MIFFPPNTLKMGFKFNWEFFQLNLVKLVVKVAEDFDWDNFLFNFDRRFD